MVCYAAKGHREPQKWNPAKGFTCGKDSLAPSKLLPKHEDPATKESLQSRASQPLLGHTWWNRRLSQTLATLQPITCITSSSVTLFNSSKCG